MRHPGRFFSPAALFFFLFVFGMRLWSSEEAVFYSIPADKANANLNQRLQWETPRRQFIFLNGAWQLKTTGSDQVLGNVNIPCTFQIKQNLIFETSFNLQKQPDREYLLHLGEINGKVSLLLNDSLIYQNTRNYLPITLALSSQLLLYGQNTLKLHIKSENRRFGEAPAFYPVNLPRVEAGVLSGICLEIRPALFIRGIDAAVNVADSAAVISGKITFNRPVPPALSYIVRVAYVSAEKTLFTKDFPAQQGFQEIDLPAWPKEKISPWSPATPHRYWVEATLDSAGKEIDKIRRPLVMRTLKTDSESFWLNGQKIEINGINYVYQNKEGSLLFDPGLAQQDLQMIKQQGFNAIRVILNPLPEQFYRLCDEVGLLCFQDLPLVYWLPAKSANQISAIWPDYLRQVQFLASCYNSLAASGVAFYPDGESAAQRDWLKEFAKPLKAASVPVYVSTLLPEPAISDIVDFQIVEILQRNRLEANLHKVDQLLEGKLYFPSVYSKAVTYRVDSTTIAYDLQQIRNFYEKLSQNALPEEVEGNFIMTYNDFYLQLPSVQNGLEKDFFYNRVGQVDLKRHSRGIILANPEDSLNAAPAEFDMVYEDKGTHSFLYIIIGFLNIFIFLITYRRYRIFRQNLGYSIQKPHGFFVNLSERIIIPYKQSFFLMLVIALNGAIVYSSIAYFYRSHLLFDYLLSLFFYTPAWKSLVVKIVWDQVLFLLVVTIKIIIIFYLLALIIKLYSFIGRRRVLFNQALAVSIWAASPFIILLPLGILMYNLLLIMKSYWFIWGGLLYFHFWFYLRWINGIRVLTDRLYARVFILFTVIFIAAAAAVAYFYEGRYQVWGQLEYWYRLYGFYN